MIKGTVKQSVKIMSGPGSTFNVVGNLSIWDRIIADMVERQWLHIIGINDVHFGGGWASSGTDQKYISWGEFPDEPNPGGEPPPPVPSRSQRLNQRLPEGRK